MKGGGAIGASNSSSSASSATARPNRRDGIRGACGDKPRAPRYSVSPAEKAPDSATASPKPTVSRDTDRDPKRKPQREPAAAGRRDVADRQAGELRRDDPIDAFLQAAERRPPPARRSTGSAAGRLIFAMDATASRAPTWDRACQLQGDMFTRCEALGGLDVQLVYYRGHGECRASRWHSEPASLLRAMTAVQCRAGATQIGRVLRHTVAEARAGGEAAPVAALVFVGDCCEESPESLAAAAGELRLLGVPAFVFQEGADPLASRSFAQIARLSGGAHCQFDAGSAAQLGALLNAAAVYASGGAAALDDYARLQSDARVRALLAQLD